jgi:peptide/nickel transport system ATP-binding protein
MAEAIVAAGVIRIHPSAGGPVAALRGLDLRVDEGEIAAVVGPSGSGKSTLLRLLAGLDRPSAGTLRVLGTDVGRASDTELGRLRRASVGFVDQHYRRALSPYLRATDAIELPMALRGETEGVRRSRVAELLEAVGLGDRGQAFRHELSGGEQQRLAFAVAMAVRPRLLLADEPTGELDGTTATTILDLLRELVQSEGATCVVVTHDLLVERIADRVVHIADGRVVAESEPKAGGPPRRAVDSQGWLAPAPTEPHGPMAGIERPPTADMAVVLDGVTRRYEDGRSGSLGLASVSVGFGRGGFHVVTGPSGSGKTTLLRVVTGLDRPTEGRVTTLGEDLGRLDREALARFRASHVAIVDQVRDLVPFLSAVENVELGLAIRGRTGEHATDRAREALASLGLVDLANRLPDGLSAGERLRVALARALAADPDLLVLDEPTATLDRRAAAAVAAILAGLDPRITLLVTTHDPALIEASSDRFALAAAQVLVAPA